MSLEQRLAHDKYPLHVAYSSGTGSGLSPPNPTSTRPPEVTLQHCHLGLPVRGHLACGQLASPSHTNFPWKRSPVAESIQNGARPTSVLSPCCTLNQLKPLDNELS